jgi:hypothetical protein
MIHTRKLTLSPYGKPSVVECMVELDLDLDRIAYVLGQKALRNKSMKSRALSNLIVATVRLTQAEKEKAE